MEITKRLARKRIHYNEINYGTLKIFLKHHIDVFGLTEDDLAVDFGKL